MTAPKCTSWLGHRFKARYSKGAATNPGMKVSSGLYAADLIDLLEQYRPITYEGDVCTRCGCTVNRPTPSKEKT